MSLRRYKRLGEPPVVVFVVEDDEKSLQFLRAADSEMTGRIGRYGVAEASWPDVGRQRLSWWPSAMCTRARCALSGCPSSRRG